MEKLLYQDRPCTRKGAATHANIFVDIPGYHSWVITLGLRGILPKEPEMVEAAHLA